MAFSVLLSLYAKESPANLREALDSVYDQTLPPDEVVMVIDGPITPELTEVVEEYKRLKPNFITVPLAENRGLGQALDAGLTRCSNDLVARMDTDDICRRERFSRQVKLMQQHPEIDFCSSWVEEFVGSPDNVVSVRRLPETSPEIFRYGRTRNPMNHPAVILRKHVVEGVGGYHHFPLFEDYHLWARMLCHGSKAYNIQESLLWFRTSTDTFRRRGGIRYALDELRLQNQLHKLGYISILQMLKNDCVRFTARIVPNSLRGFIYHRFLRK